MTDPVVVVDYGLGNLHSVGKAIEKAGGRAVVTSDPAAVSSSRSVVLPGVGAFGRAMENLSAAGLIDPVRSAAIEAISGRGRFLGICLGLQVLFPFSEESPERPGLGVIEGSVVRFRGEADLAIPQIGWNRLRGLSAVPPFSALEEGEHLYFVHSYFVLPEDDSLVAARTRYGGDYVSAVMKGGLTAVQFHPEKSGDTGIRFLKAWLE